MLSADRSNLQLVSLVTADGALELSLAPATVPRPGPDEVVIRVDASPINPSDLGLLLASADPSSLVSSGTAERPVLKGKLASIAPFAQRVGIAMPLGNEGAGTVVEAGSSPAAQALLGKVVAVMTGSGMWSQYRVAPASLCLPLNPGATAAEGASACINPLTALGFLETMRREKHTAIANTAAASNLGQMLVRLCRADGVPLVNIVRSVEQERILQSMGAQYVCNSARPTFEDDLTEAFAETGVTLAFDAIGGGNMPGTLLHCMERALSRKATAYSRYGSATHKQVYVYGGLDPAPTELVRTFGLAWGLGGWLVMPVLQTLEPARVGALRQRIADELTTTFASAASKSVSLAEALRPEIVAAYARKATGEKYLIAPNHGHLAPFLGLPSSFTGP